MSDGFKSEYFSILAALEKNNFWFRVRNEIIIWAMKKYATIFNSYLEIGCGTGFVLQAVANSFPGMKMTGSEYFEEGLEFAAKRVPTGDFIQLDARDMPFESEFSMIGAFDVLEHIKEDKVVLDNINKALNNDGLLVLTVPQHKWLWSQVDVFSCHQRRYTERDLLDKLDKSGFTIVRSTSFVSFLLPVMLLSRVLKKDIDAGKYDATSELKISPVLNSLFSLVMKFDFFLIRMGLDLPIGGSRLIVARKR